MTGGGPAMRLVASSAEPVVAAPEPVAFEAPPAPSQEVVPDIQVKSLADIANLADANRDKLFKVNFKAYVRPVRIEPGKLEISLTPDAPKTLASDISARLKAWTGRNWFVSVSREEGGQTLAEMETAKRDSAFLDARSDPAVAAILAKFPGARIIDVRIPEAPEADEQPADLPPEPPADDDDN